MKRIVDDHARLKRCTGCGETKRADEFRDNGRGFPTARCKACHAADARDRYAKKYAADAAFRTAEVKRASEPEPRSQRYWRQRPLDTGAFVRICNCHGKVCRVWLVDDTIRCAVSARALRRFKVAAA